MPLISPPLKRGPRPEIFRRRLATAPEAVSIVRSAKSAEADFARAHQAWRLSADILPDLRSFTSS